jgi:hypothetical protein
LSLEKPVAILLAPRFLSRIVIDSFVLGFVIVIVHIGFTRSHTLNESSDAVYVVTSNL